MARNTALTLRTVMEDTLRQLQAQLEASESAVVSGWPIVDELLGGSPLAQVIVLGARPAMGKTAVALNWALHTAEQGRRVLMITPDMARTEVGVRLIALHSRVGLNALRGAHPTMDELRRCAESLAQLADLPLAMDDRPLMTATEVRDSCLRYAAEGGLDLVVVDQPTALARPRQAAEHLDAIRAVANETDCVALVLANLTRDPENRRDNRPVLSDLRQARTVARRADIVLLAYRDAYYHPDAEPPDGLELIVARNPGGRCGTAWLRFDAACGRIEPMRDWP